MQSEPSERGGPGAVMITGAGRRIGRALALDLAGAGWRVAVHYNRSKVEAEALVAEIERAGGTAAAIAADLAETDAISHLVPEAGRRLGPLTCLINNASVFEVDTLASATPRSWDEHQSVNLRAPVFLAQALARQLPTGAQGNVINIIDQRVWRLTPDFFSYTISKAGLWTATRTLAQALAPHVRVNAIGPGPVLRSVHQTQGEFDAESRSTLLGRGPTPGEIAQTVRFILAAPAMTGQMIALDGGQHLLWAHEPAAQA